MSLLDRYLTACVPPEPCWSCWSVPSCPRVYRMFIGAWIKTSICVIDDVYDALLACVTYVIDVWVLCDVWYSRWRWWRCRSHSKNGYLVSIQDSYWFCWTANVYSFLRDVVSFYWLNLGKYIGAIGPVYTPVCCPQTAFQNNFFCIRQRLIFQRFLLLC